MPIIGLHYETNVIQFSQHQSPSLPHLGKYTAHY
ncbi:hypothetical protein J2X43_004381 [Rhizobium sp. BE258]|nr:hypothetical protein [Rhizobium sp. BE258]